MDADFGCTERDTENTNLQWRWLTRSWKIIQGTPCGASSCQSDRSRFGFYTYIHPAIPLLTTPEHAIGSGRATGRLLRREPGIARVDGQDYFGEVMAEKLAQELLWITNKLRSYGIVNEALVQWSFASGLASLSLTASPRVQCCIVQISAILFGELSRKDLEISRQVKFRLLVLWIPLFCHASNGLAHPVLTSFQKADIERAMDEVISRFPALDQEVILTTWLQDYAISVSDWPNLRLSYDRWCQSTRELVT
ncbi:hypothetical protein DITRI_Ditri01bG0104100 [Diplodiscus trichospermus]